MASSISPAPGLDLSSAISRWHALTPLRIRRDYRAHGEERGWRAWSRHLQNRRRPAALADLLPGGQAALLWGFGNHVEVARSLGRLDELRAASQRSEIDPLAVCPAAAVPVREADALATLAWCHAMPHLAGLVDAATWWAALDRLVAVARQSALLPLAGQPLLHQLLAGELPLALGYLFPELRCSTPLLAQARAALSTGLIELLDQGIPHGQHFPVFRPLVACWTRSAAMGVQLPKSFCSRRAANQYAWAVRQAVNLTRASGGYPFDSAESDPTFPPLIQAALSLGGDDDDRWIAAEALPKWRKPPTAEPKRRPSPALHSEWASVGVLRPTWSRRDPRLTVLYPGRDVRLELEAARQPLFSGVWDLEVVRDGQTLAPVSHWAETCWVSDKDVDYLELEADLGGGVRVERHLAFAREDRFLFLADAVFSDRPAELEYRGRLPLADIAAAHEADETREVTLSAGKPAAVAMPLALPEWRVDPRVGHAAVAERHLELRQSAHGSGLFAPWFIDLDPRRLPRPATWRQLTVAENRNAVPPEVAVGYRVMAGRRQWLLYRTLGPLGNRTLLGHNLVTQLLIARFGADGEIEPLVEIE